VEVSLRGVNGSLVVAVRDDGTGIPPTGLEGNGLAGLAARVEAAGGRLSVAGGPGQGTTVAATLSVPDGAA
jgi:signal transduction histidine kinase